MPLSLKALVEQTDEFDLPVGDESVHIVFRPGFMTTAKQKEIKRLVKSYSNAEESDLDASPLFHQIKGLVVSWDVLDETEQPIPITDDGLAEIPLQFLSTVVVACLEHQSPAGASGKGPRS